MEVFAMHAHVLNASRFAVCDRDGMGLSLDRDGDLSVVHSVDAAVSKAELYIKELLMRAQRPEQVWSLTIRVGGITIPYGAQPPMPAIPRGGRSLPPTDIVSRIFAEYREGDGPRKALENGVRIIRALTTSRRVAA